MGDYWENPDPEEERIEREAAEVEFFRMECEKEGRLEKDLKLKKRTVSNQTYENFYNDSMNFHLGRGKFPYEKAELLVKYFPAKFGCNGKEPIHKMKHSQIGSVFKNLVDYSKKRMNE